MSEEELKKDEAMIEEVSTFLKDAAIDKLIKDLQNTEGIPTDSESLENGFHQHGINMRYLGAVSKKMKGKEFKHLKTMLEKEVVFRSCKHIFNEKLRETPETYLSSVISHLFNILVAPNPQIELMNEGKIVFQDKTIQAQLPQEKDLVV